MRTWRLLLIGFGTVGQGTAERLRDAGPALRAAGCDPRIVGVIDAIHGCAVEEAGLEPDDLLRAVAAGESLGAPAAVPAAAEIDADVVLELTPTDLTTGEPGLSHARTALAAGRHVITTNKGPVALAWPELSALARDNGVQLRCEGTVMSGTPLLSLVEAGLAGAGIRSLRGILNGTCNFILSRMEDGAGYDDALAEAQSLGYAEADPSGDVEGWDAAAKVTILANQVLGAGISLADVEREGITSIDAAQVAEAAIAGQRWRLIGAVEHDGERWNASVSPMRLPELDPLARVTGPGNLVEFQTEALGAVSIAGPGAGREATGHALVADLLAIHRSGA